METWNNFLVKFARTYKSDAFVDEVQLIRVNSTVSSICYATGKQENVSISRFAWEQAFKTVGESLISIKDRCVIELDQPARVQKQF